MNIHFDGEVRDSECGIFKNIVEKKSFPDIADYYRRFLGRTRYSPKTTTKYTMESLARSRTLGDMENVSFLLQKQTLQS